MKKIVLAFLLLLPLLILSLANAQLVSNYGRKEGVNPAAFTLTIFSPNDQTAYANTMLLNFNITWTTFPTFISFVGPPLKGDYAYSIDDSPLVPIELNQSASDLSYAQPNSNFTINPTFSYLVNASNLANGNHKITIIVGLYMHPDYYYINQSCNPTLFSVQNSTPSLSSTTIPSLTSTSTPSLNTQKPSESQSLAALSSPTQQPTPTPAFAGSYLIADPMVDYTPTLMLLAILLSTVALGGLAYFYFKKRK